MNRIQCINAVRAVINYNYPGFSDNPFYQGVIVSRRPGVLLTVRQVNEATSDCEIYNVTIRSPLVTWSLPNMQGVESDVGNYERFFAVHGPVMDLKFEVLADPDSYYGIQQKVTLKCRGPFGSGCQPLDYYAIGIRRGGSGSAPLFDTDYMTVEGVQNINSSDPLPYRFAVIDETGLIFERTELVRPNTAVECIGFCQPGGSRIGDCCIDCSNLGGILEEIRQAVRRV